MKISRAKGSKSVQDLIIKDSVGRALKRRESLILKSRMMPNGLFIKLMISHNRMSAVTVSNHNKLTKIGRIYFSSSFQTFRTSS